MKTWEKTQTSNVNRDDLNNSDIDAFECKMWMEIMESWNKIIDMGIILLSYNNYNKLNNKKRFLILV